MRAPLLASLALLALVMATAEAAVFNRHGVQLLLPAGFAGGTPQIAGDGEIATYRKPTADGTRATTIVVSFQAHAAFGAPLQAERDDAQRRWLVQYLDGIGTRRQSFEALRVASRLLGETRAAVAEWLGVQDGEPLAGALYASNSTRHVILLSVQGFPQREANDLAAALDAVLRAFVDDN